MVPGYEPTSASRVAPDWMLDALKDALPTEQQPDGILAQVILGPKR